MLRRDEHALDLDRPAPAVLVDLVADRHLRLPVRAQVRQDVPSLRTSRKPARELVGEHDRQRHQLRRLVGRVAEHQPLVAGADAVERIVVARVVLHLERGVDALRDVGRLLVERDDHAAGLGVEAVLGARVADLLDPLAHEARDVDVGLGRDLARDDDEAGGDERLAGDATLGVVGEDRVEDGVRDLVGDLVGVALGDRLGGEGERARRHRRNPRRDTRDRVTVAWRLIRRSAPGPSARRRAPAAAGPRAPRRRPR